MIRMMMNKNCSMQINCQISIQIFKLGPQANVHPAKLTHIPWYDRQEMLVNSSMFWNTEWVLYALCMFRVEVKEYHQMKSCLRFTLGSITFAFIFCSLTLALRIRQTVNRVFSLSSYKVSCLTDNEKNQRVVSFRCENYF